VHKAEILDMFAWYWVETHHEVTDLEDKEELKKVQEAER